MPRLLMRDVARAFVLVATLTSCRGLIGIEELDVRADGGADSSSGGPGGMTDAAPESGARDGGPDASGPDPSQCAGTDAQTCRSCCKTGPFAGAYANMLVKLGQNCICGTPTSSVCGPQCAGQPQCPGSPAGSSTEQACATCIDDSIILGMDAKCMSVIDACRSDPSCDLELKCIRGCN